MIVSRIIKICKADMVDADYIETELKKNGIEPVRWAITGAEDNNFIISVSYLKQDK